MFYVKLIGYAFLIQIIFVINILVFIGFDKLEHKDRIGYSIMSLIAIAVVWLIVAAANNSNDKSKEDNGYPP